MINFNTEIAKSLKRKRPKDKDGSGTFDVSLSSVDILSKIKYVLRTDIEPFDMATGGLPFGRIVETYGLESCGKTSICIRSLVKAQIGSIYERVKDDAVPGGIRYTKLPEERIAVTTLFIDNEQSVDDDAKIVVEGHELQCVLARCDTVDQLFKIADETIDAVALYQKEEDKKAKEEKRDPLIYFVVIVVDTVAGTSHKKEMMQAWDTEDYPRQAKMMSQGFRRLQRSINRNNVLMICTNQVREQYKQARPGQRKIVYSTPQNDDYSTFGGKALKFYASTRIFMFRLNENYRLTGAKFSQGYLLGLRTQKNRVTKPLREVRMVLLFEGGLNNDYSKLETMLFLGVATMSPSTKAITFRFSKFGIELKTFPKEVTGKKPKRAGTSLEEDDDRGRASVVGSDDDPEISAKREWPEFYAAHKGDFDRLWDKAAFDVLFGNEVAGIADPDEETIDLDEEVDED